MDVMDITLERLDEAADVLARAFADYPLMAYLFDGTGPAAFESIRETFRLTCEAHWINGDPVKGVMQDGRLIAAACLQGTERKPWPGSLEQAFTERVSEGAVERFGQFEELVTAHRPSEPHLYLVAIGVLPEARGRGVGGVLLDHIHALSAAHPVSTGVGLDTETPANVALYERFQYRVTAQGQVADVPFWCMFRPDPSPVP